MLAVAQPPPPAAPASLPRHAQLYSQPSPAGRPSWQLPAACGELVRGPPAANTGTGTGTGARSSQQSSERDVTTPTPAATATASAEAEAMDATDAAGPATAEAGSSLLHSLVGQWNEWAAHMDGAPPPPPSHPPPRYSLTAGGQLSGQRVIRSASQPFARAGSFGSGASLPSGVVRRHSSGGVSAAPSGARPAASSAAAQALPQSTPAVIAAIGSARPSPGVTAFPPQSQSRKRPRRSGGF